MAALITTRGLGRRSTESTLVPTFGLGFGVPVGPGNTITDVIGITDEADRTIAYVRVVTDDVGIVDISFVPASPVGLSDEIERVLDRADPIRSIRPDDITRLLDRADPIRSIRPDDITRLLDGIDEYLRGTARTRRDVERIHVRLDPERTITPVDDGVDPWA